MRHGRPVLVLALVLLVGLFVVACAAPPTPTLPPPTAVAKPTAVPPTSAPTQAPPTVAPTKAPPTATTAPVLEKKEIKIGVTVSDLSFQPLFTADSEKTYAKYGLDVKLLVFKGGSENIRAMTGGELDISAGSVSELITGLAANQPIKAFWGLGNSPVYEVWAQPSIKTWQDAKGKKFGISSFGAASHQVLEFMATKGGLKKEDMTFVQAGGANERYTALKTKAIDLTLLTQPGALLAQREGYTRLAKITDVLPGWPNEVLYAKTDFLAKNPNTIKAFLSGLVDAVKLETTNMAAVQKAMESYVGCKPDDCRDGYAASFKGTFPANGVPALEGMTLQAQFALDGGQAKKLFTLDEMIDWTYIQQFGGKKP